MLTLRRNMGRTMRYCGGSVKLSLLSWMDGRKDIHINPRTADLIVRLCHRVTVLKGKAGGGWGGIRTHETVARLPVFKTGAFNHSATHPSQSVT